MPPAVARALPLPPEPVEIARRLVAAGGRSLALLHAADRAPTPWSRRSFIAVDPDRVSHALDPLEDDDATARPAGRWSAVPRWIGVVPYDALRGLERPGWAPAERRPAPALLRPEWHRYPAIVCVDHPTGAVHAVGADPAAVERLARACCGASPRAARTRVEVRDDEPLARHLERIAAARELIARGDLYQVNLARPIRIEVVGARGPFDAADALALHERLVRAAPTPLGACLCLDRAVTVVTTTPELLLAATTAAPPESSAAAPHFTTLLTAPIKGTRPRGSHAEEDEALARELDESAKERAELTMIVDVERHDLGGVAAVGSVRLLREAHVTTHRTVHHREAWVGARVAPGRTRRDVLRAMLPSGSVTGAPKVRAMEVIAALEARRRGLYTGALGFVAHDGSVTLAMAIRTATLVDGAGDYLAGGGIVADSDPRQELDETRWKAVQLARAASG